MVVYLGNIMGILIHRNTVGDSIALVQAILLALIVFIIIELAIYSNMKAHAYLFLQIKVSEQQ